jgi:hypothetical protein
MAKEPLPCPQLLGIFLAALALAACSDENRISSWCRTKRPPRSTTSARSGDARRQHTLDQNEPNRIYSEGSLR